MAKRVHGQVKEPACRKHMDCFANRDGRCSCLTDNGFGKRDCPFYKPAGAGKGEKDGVEVMDG